MRRFLSLSPLLAALLALTIALPAAAAPQETHALVRLWLDEPGATSWLLDHPGLDIASLKPGVHADIVASAADQELLRTSGFRLTLVHQDLEAFYAARLAPEKSDSFGIYHNWPEAIAFVDSLRMLYPEVVSEKWSIGQSIEGRDLWCFRMSDNPDVDEDEPEVLFDAVHHAREVMSSEFVILFAQYLAQKYTAGDPEVTYLLNEREVYFVPVVNPDGFVYNNWGDMWRKNRRNNGGGCWGVDNNRNYPYQWGGSGSSGDPCDPTYRGPTAGSEPENQALMGLFNGHQFVTHNSYHTHGNLTLFPWAYTDSHTPDHSIFVHMGNQMTMYNGYVAGQPGAVLYTVSGGALDWVYGAQSEHPKCLSFSNEIGGSADGFWPEESRRGQLFQENIWPAIYLMRVADAFVAVEGPVVVGGDGNGRLDPGESAGLAFTISNQSVVAAAGNVAVTLFCDDPYLQLDEAQRSVGSMAQISSLNLASNPLPVTVAASCPVGRVVTLIAQVSHDGGSLSFPLTYVVGPESIVFNDDFEHGTSAWTLEGTWGLTSTQSHSPVTSLTDSPGGNYVDESTTAATLTGGHLASRLTYWQRYNLETDWDYGYVQVSADGGPWSTVESYTGLASSWHQIEIPLTSWLGQSLRVRFQLVSDYSITRDGWYVDDVVLYGYGDTNQTPPPPLQLAPPPGAVVSANPVLTVANSTDPDGGGPITYGFRVYADELGTQPVAAADDLPETPGQTSWTAPTLAAGTYWWRAYAADDQARGLLGEFRSFEVQDLSDVAELIGDLRLVALGPAADGRARLRLDLPTAADVALDLYDARGYRVRRLQAGSLAAGSQVLTWDGRDGSGRNVASGVYFARLRVERRTLTTRVLLVR
jgi:carboxypeptidase T